MNQTLTSIDRQRALQIGSAQPQRNLPWSAHRSPAVTAQLRAALIAAVPSLRAFALSLTCKMDAADDLVQETILRAWANLFRFEPGTNIDAWLFTILRNVFLSQRRKAGREVQDPDEL